MAWLIQKPSAPVLLLVGILLTPSVVAGQDAATEVAAREGKQAPTNVAIIFPYLEYIGGGDEWRVKLNVLPVLLERPLGERAALRMQPLVILATGAHIDTQVDSLFFIATLPYYFEPRPEGWAYRGGYAGPFAEVEYDYDAPYRTRGPWVGIFYGGETGYGWGGDEKSWFVIALLRAGLWQGRNFGTGRISGPGFGVTGGLHIGYRLR